LATAPRFAQPRQDQLCAEIGPRLGDASRRHSQAKVTTQPEAAATPRNHQSGRCLNQQPQDHERSRLSVKVCFIQAGEERPNARLATAHVAREAKMATKIADGMRVPSDVTTSPP
jgi:hypothetical protein